MKKSVLNGLWNLLLLCCLAQGLCLHAGDRETETRGVDGRLFSIAITPSKVEDYRDLWTVYEDAVDVALEAGIDVPGELSFGWAKIESKSFFGSITYEDASSIAAIEIYQRKKLPVIVTISPFSTAVNLIPDDLQHLPYDHPDIIERLKRFIDWIYRVTANLPAVAIVLGNEFDVHLSFEAAQGRDRWSEFEGLVVAVRSYVKSLPKWSEVPFAVEPTYAGLMGASWQALQRINRHTDIVGVSYYPISDSGVEEPGVLAKHLADLFRVYPDKKIDFYQYGYPSSARIGSSLEKQRKFIEETFQQWDRHKQIRLITFTWLYESQGPLTEQLADETMGDIPQTEALMEFLGSLGLLGVNVGEEKPAFVELKQQARARGWGVRKAPEL